MRRAPALLLLLAVAVSGTVATWSGPEARAQDTSRRLLVFGVDGLDARVTERLLSEGKLPNLSRLAEQGAYSRLQTTNPAQSPVAWASITTGLNPGGTGVYDFLRRRFTARGDVSIDLALAGRDSEPLLPGWRRPAIVGGAGLLGAGLGVLLALLLGRRWPRWRSGGALQAAALLPATLASLGALAFVGWVPERMPKAINLRQGEPFWTALDRAGVRCVAIDAPLAFPVEPMDNGACLCGLGVPDAQQQWFTYYLWSEDTRRPASTETGGKVRFVEPGSTEFELVLVGPPDPIPDDDAIAADRDTAQRESATRRISHDWTPVQRRRSETREQLLLERSKLRLSLDVAIRRGRDCTITAPGGASVTVAEGEVSDWLPVVFERNPLVKVRAQVRFVLSSAGSPEEERPFRPFELYVGPVQFDSADPDPRAPFATPGGFSASLAAQTPSGRFDTIGWREPTNPVKDAMLADHLFVRHVYEGLAEHEAKYEVARDRDDWDNLFVMFSEPDRVQHALWRHVDPEHPLHDADAAPAFAGEIDRIYMEMDRILGETLDAVGDDTDVLVVSDHGFASFRRAVNLNNFLRSKGYQVARAGGGTGGGSVSRLFDGSAFFTDVEWDRTQAYGVGLGNLYLNLQGREPGGIVPPTESQDVLDAIRADLLALRDGDRPVVKEVYYGSDVYSGSETFMAPDLVVGFHEGYRVSWQSTLGELDSDVITDNTQRWSGDHCSVDPSIVPGVLFSSRPLAEGPPPRVEDVAVTILAHFGVAVGARDGRALQATR